MTSAIQHDVAVSSLANQLRSSPNTSPFPIDDRSSALMLLRHSMMATSPSSATTPTVTTMWSTATGGDEEATVDLESMLGPRRLELNTLVPITIIYCVIFVTGVVGNVCTAIVIKRNKYMHTATNYYLCNLVLSDMLVLVLGLPLETYTFWSAYPWIFGETFCVVRSMAAETSTYASILTITAFTVERYLAICHPMKAKLMSGLSRAVRTIVIVWVVAAGCSVPIWIQYGVTVQSDASGRPIPESALCMIRPDRHIRHVFEVSSIVFFIVPMSIISVLYGLIGLSIRRSALYRDSSSEYGGSGNGNRSLQQSPQQLQQQHHHHPSDRKDVRRAIQQARARLSVLKMLGEWVAHHFAMYRPI
jgi:neuromedin U receptor 1